MYLLLEFLKELISWCAEYVMNLVDLVKFVISREKWEKCKDLEIDAPYSPVVHFVIVVTICQQTLGWSIPSCGDILSEGRLRVNTTARAKVCKFDLVIFD